MKLHLGCGEQYLDGYVNIDFPPATHSIQTKGVADQYADILTIKYPAGSVDEVRLHHVFEHFTRPIACGLLTAWFSWMPAGSILHVEVPDFAAAARRVLGRFRGIKERCAAERHIFGSQEAEWAKHCAGYTQQSLGFMLGSFGFETDRVVKKSWKATDNLEIVALRQSTPISFDEFEKRTDAYLRDFLVDEGESELRLLGYWMKNWREQALRGWA